tara:strand:- start:406 stop:594 length:189 start_codon:yes stop_codon:yes gene_type:complete
MFNPIIQHPHSYKYLIFNTLIYELDAKSLLFSSQTRRIINSQFSKAPKPFAVTIAFIKAIEE